MKCDKCGTEYGADGMPECADALLAQLASMTKRAEDAEAKLAEVPGLVESGDELHEACLARCLDAEAKLATAVDGLKLVTKLGHTGMGEAAWRIATSTLHALGIDPSKETT